MEEIQQEERQLQVIVVEECTRVRGRVHGRTRDGRGVVTCAGLAGFRESGERGVDGFADGVERFGGSGRRGR